MSYDFSVYVKRTSEVDVLNVNQTSNVSGVWHDSFKAIGGVGHFADVLQAGTAEDAGKLVAVMLDWIRSQPDGWIASYDAANEWGTGAGAVEVLERLKTACEKNPAGRVSISR